MITAADTVRVGLLGPLEVTDAAGRPVHVGGQRVRALLILLALDAGRVVSARSLIERLWPDERPADAANALQSLVSRLRVALRQAGLPAAVLESSAVGYRLAAAAEAVDALAFEAQARAGRQALASGDPAAAAAPARRGDVWYQPTSFVGRDTDVVAVLKQLAAERLVTLTGPGGVGKTRLAAEAACRLADSAWFTGSAWFAELAPLTEPSEVPYAVLTRSACANGRSVDQPSRLDRVRYVCHVHAAHTAARRCQVPHEPLPASSQPASDHAGIR